ncbi:TPM domain-containing protein [Ralstonia solanacearum]|uniref:TPM domain-containing protein n=1 Tax=Ralstonia solanacearum TaxID=305 RepID=UPI00202A5449|nr:YgcG family protein [Ralstonia solanacearum]MCL9842880.1 YgcG family protein [Ralstonia solanacearum]MDC6252495.1 YgcG family protein [Ralstonia solanacearum]MDC6257076.1 YgcG family protein [Ralstonia solanacearum]MDC6303159.1 YgcG family protein [Ralstonia solanacearum]
MSLRMRALLASLVTVMLWLAAAWPAHAQADLAAVPPLAARVTDLTGTLTAQQRGALEQVLADYEQQRGSQIFVLMVPSTAPEPIEAYGIRVAEAWKADRKGVDDGAIVLIAKDNPASLRKMRIEVGRGLEGSLTDAQSKRILQDVMAPHFRQGDFYGGLSAGISAIETVIAQESLPPAERGRAQRAESGIGTWLPVLFPLAIIVFFVLSAAMRSGGRVTGSLPGRPGSRVMMGNRGWGPGAIGGFGGGLGGGWGRGGGSGGDGGGGFGGGGGGDFGGGGASGNW